MMNVVTFSVITNKMPLVEILVQAKNERSSDRIQVTILVFFSLNEATIPSSPRPTFQQAGAEIRRSRPVRKRHTITHHPGENTRLIFLF
jgi:hypothetical protein